jgi:hypothetical protein
MTCGGSAVGRYTYEDCLTIGPTRSNVAAGANVAKNR